MNVTNHVKLRYVQRVHGITDERESRQFLAQNDEMITERVKTMFEHAEYVWTGRLNDKHTSHFYLADETVLLVDESNTSLVTLYKCDFGFPVAINRQTIKSLMSEIRKLREKSEKKSTKIHMEIAKREVEIENIDAQIAVKQAEIETLYERRKAVEGELGTVKQEIQCIEREIDRVAKMMLNSVEYRKDILQNKFTG